MHEDLLNCHRNPVCSCMWTNSSFSTSFFSPPPSSPDTPTNGYGILITLLSELKVALFWKGARYFLLFKEQPGKKSWNIMIDQPSARRWRCFLSEAKIVFVEKKCPNHISLVFFPFFWQKASRSALKCYVVNEGNSVGMSAARVWVETNI